MEDRRLAHDLKNSIMVIRNLMELIQQDKLKEADKDQAFAIIKAECEKVLELCK
jgi:hypothetical protein